MASFPLGKFILKDSLIHRLDARFKLFAMILLMVTVFLKLNNLWMDFTLYFLILLFVFLLMGIAHIKIKSLFNSLKPLWFMIIFLFIVNVLVIRTGDYVHIWFFDLYFDAIYNTIYTFFRLLLMVAFSLILTSTTRPTDLTYALEWYLHPLTFIKVKVHIIAMIISLALRFIPTLLEETNRIMKAQASRGVDFENGTIKEKIRAITALIIPLFVSSIQRSTELADAMEARGYDPDGVRTHYRVMKFSIRDLIAFLLILMFFIGVLLLMIFNVNFYFMVM